MYKAVLIGARHRKGNLKWRSDRGKIVKCSRSGKLRRMNTSSKVLLSMLTCATLQDLQDRYITVPNALTVIRMGLGPYVSYALLTGQPVAAFDAFVVAGALDGIDGWIARKFNQSSIIGSYLDPLADKVLIACAAGALTWLGVVPWWATLVMVGRDAGLVAGGLWHRVKTKPAGVGFFSTSHSDTLVVEPSGLSKFNTGMQLLCFTSALTHVAFGMPGAEAVTGMAAVATATTVASGYGYWKKLPFAARKRGASTGEHEQ